MYNPTYNCYKSYKNIALEWLNNRYIVTTKEKPTLLTRNHISNITMKVAMYSGNFMHTNYRVEINDSL